MWRAWWRVFRRDPGEDVDAELRYHIEERIHDYLERGMDPESARRAALERIGDVQRVREECADLLAALEPARRGLAVQPAEALREE